MVHIGTTVFANSAERATPFASRAVPARYSVLVVRDDDGNSDFIDAVCEFLDMTVERASGSDNLRAILRDLRPTAVIADLVGAVQDGFHVMKIAADHDPALPILLLTANDPALLGAVDAVRDIWGLTQVVTGGEELADLVDFVCQAARGAGRTRMMRI